MARGETIRLKGWAALIAIVLVGGFLAVKAFSAHSTLQSEAADLLKLQLAGEYASAHLSGDFRMEYSGLTGWRHRGEATALSWWLALI